MSRNAAAVEPAWIVPLGYGAQLAALAAALAIGGEVLRHQVGCQDQRKTLKGPLLTLEVHDT